MPYLGDFIGHLISEITIARAQSDLESIRIAEFYANHPILKYLPIPHFRLPDVSIEVPVAISHMEEAIKDEEPRGKLRIEEIDENLTKTVQSQISKLGLELRDEQQHEILEKVKQISSELTKIKQFPINLSFIADKITQAATDYLYEIDKEKYKPDSEDIQNITKELKTNLRVELLKHMEAPPRLDALITSTQLREIKPADILVRLNLKISEDNFEWTIIEAGEKGKTEDRLVPE
ncbi:MAG: hypothetical protein ACFFCI_01310 [Promethearchaeota archaeon]